MRVFCEELVGCETTGADEAYDPEDAEAVGEVECDSSGTGTRESVGMVDWCLFYPGSSFRDRNGMVGRSDSW
jgi:hypothetical protein